MTERETFIRAICERPDDDLPRLVFADWLEENDGDGTVSNLFDEHAEFIRLQCEFAKTETEADAYVLYSEFERILSENRQWLWPEFADWAWSIDGEDHTQDPAPSLLIRRGFVTAIRLPLAAFMEHAETLFRSHPITRVTLTDREPLRFSNYCYWGWPNNGLADSGNLPREIMLMLARNAGVLSHTAPNFPRRESAFEALSAACVSYGRKLAGLPPLDIASPSHALR